MQEFRAAGNPFALTSGSSHDVHETAEVAVKIANATLIVFLKSPARFISKSHFLHVAPTCIRCVRNRKKPDF